jgi:hypothetical protein
MRAVSEIFENAIGASPPTAACNAGPPPLNWIARMLVFPSRLKSSPVTCEFEPIPDDA